MHLNCTRISKIGAVYELSRVNVNLGEVPLSTFTRNLPYIASDLCIYALKFDARRQVKIRCQGKSTLREIWHQTLLINWVSVLLHF